MAKMTKKEEKLRTDRNVPADRQLSNWDQANGDFNKLENGDKITIMILLVAALFFGAAAFVGGLAILFQG